MPRGERQRHAHPVAAVHGIARAALPRAERRGALARRRRHRVPDPARTLGRGRHDPGHARAGRPSLRRRRRPGIGAGHGQALRQDRVRPGGHPDRARLHGDRPRMGERPAAGARLRRGARLAGVHQAGASGVERRGHEDLRTRRPRRRRWRQHSPRTTRCSSRPPSWAARSSAACSPGATAAPTRVSLAGRDRHDRPRVLRLRGQIPRRERGRRGLPDRTSPTRSSGSSAPSRRGHSTPSGEPGWRAPTSF